MGDETFRVILSDVDGHEGFDAREFDLKLNTSFPIGRSSRNSAKPELMPAATNAYINSPVISREHAVLAANATSGVPHVYLKDVGSMHGTTVNGKRLLPNISKLLVSGDLLQFGIDVNRNEEFYVARKYIFHAHLVPPQEPYSLGFTVPDSEEEDIGTAPRRGSQNNPLTIDDSESELDTPEQVTMVGGDLIVHHEQAASFAEDQPHYDEYSQSALHTASTEEPNTEDGGVSPIKSSDTDDQEEMHDTDLESGSPSVVTSVEDEDEDSLLNLELAGLDYESEEDSLDAASHQALVDQESVKDTPAPKDFSMHDYNAFSPREPFSPVAAFAPAYTLISGLPSMVVNEDSVDTSVFSESLPPPLPPRPSAALPPFFDRTNVSFSTQQNDQSTWHSEQMPNASNYVGTNYGDRPSLFSPAPVPTVTSARGDKAISFDGGNIANFPPSADRIQTPPLVPSSDVTSSTPPPPSRRTKVSITEIVEEQPPTPTSVKNLKRKADIIDDDETPAADQPTFQTTGAEAVSTTAEARAVEQVAAAIAQRSKKQPRSIMSKLKHTATFLSYGAIGAVGAVAVLSNLPDTFFI